MKGTTDHIRTAITLALVFGAMAAPAKAMLPRDQAIYQGSGAAAQVAAGKSQSGRRAVVRAELGPGAAPVRVVRVGYSHGFGWGDAAIGGAAVLALAMIALGAAMATGSRDGRRRPATRTSS